MRVLHVEITQDLNSKLKWPATDPSWAGSWEGSQEGDGNYAWSGHTLARHGWWRARTAEESQTTNLPKSSTDCYPVVLGLNLGEGGKRGSVTKCKQKTDFAEIAHLPPWPWKASVVPQLPARKQGRWGAAGAAPALGIGHVPGEGARLRPGQDTSPNTCRTSLLLCRDTTTDSTGIPHLPIAASILLI